MIYDRNRLSWRLLMGAVTLTTLTVAAWAAPATAVYGGENAATQGNWIGVYGSNGYLIANGPAQVPTFGTVSVTGAMPYTWAPNTSDVRALISDPQDNPTLGRIASAFTQYQSKGFTINFTTVNGITEAVVLYMLDWVHAARTQVVTIRDASTNALLDQRTFSNFSNGVYEGWYISGNVTIAVTPVGYSMPAVSGVFFGLGSAPPQPNNTQSSAAYQGVDLTTQGNWKGVYGAHGYMIANNGSMPPSYATADVNMTTGDGTFFTYTWGAGAYLTDVRALQTNSGRIASEYTNYQSKSFNINVNINDGGTHSVALYMLDWDTTTRVETVTIRDLSTGTLLDTRVFNNFHNGVYALWNIKGNVVMTVQASDSTSPSVSGVFFN